MEKIHIIIPERMSGQRLDSSLSELLPNLSRSKINNWIKSGQALINNKSFKPKDKASGDEIIFTQNVYVVYELNLFSTIFFIRN